MHGWMSGGCLWHGGKREIVLIKDNITRYVNTISWHMEALVAFMERTIPKEHAFFRPKLKFSTIIWAKMRPTRTPKNLKKGIIRNLM